MDDLVIVVPWTPPSPTPPASKGLFIEERSSDLIGRRDEAEAGLRQGWVRVEKMPVRHRMERATLASDALAAQPDRPRPENGTTRDSRRDLESLQLIGGSIGVQIRYRRRRPSGCHPIPASVAPSSHHRFPPHRDTVAHDLHITDGRSEITGGRRQDQQRSTLHEHHCPAAGTALAADRHRCGRGRTRAPAEAAS